MQYVENSTLFFTQLQHSQRRISVLQKRTLLNHVLISTQLSHESISRVGLLKMGDLHLLTIEDCFPDVSYRPMGEVSVDILFSQ